MSGHVYVGWCLDLANRERFLAGSPESWSCPWGGSSSAQPRSSLASLGSVNYSQRWSSYSSCANVYIVDIQMQEQGILSVPATCLWHTFMMAYNEYCFFYNIQSTLSSNIHRGYLSLTHILLLYCHNKNILTVMLLSPSVNVPRFILCNLCWFIGFSYSVLSSLFGG